MNSNCALACRSCLHLDYIYRCPIDSSKDVLKAKELNSLFERIVSIPGFLEHGNKVISKPMIFKSNERKINEQNKEDPWLLKFDNFLSSKECDQLVKHGGRIGFNKMDNTWCDENCTNDSIVQKLVSKISKVVGIPSQNFETIHFSKRGEKMRTTYPPRHDYIDYHDEKQYGPRILSFFVFLNDVQDGGGKSFKYINGQAVRPRRGRALLWSNVLIGDFNFLKANRMVHEGLEVRKGIGK